MAQYLKINVIPDSVPTGVQKSMKLEIYNSTGEPLHFNYGRAPTPEDYPDIDAPERLGDPPGFYLSIKPDESGRTLVDPEYLSKVKVSVQDECWKSIKRGTTGKEYWIIYPKKASVVILEQNFLEVILEAPINHQPGTCVIRLDLHLNGMIKTMSEYVQKFPMPVIDEFYTDPSEGYDIDDPVTFMWNLRYAEGYTLELTGVPMTLVTENQGSVQLPIKPLDYTLKISRDSYTVLKHLPSKPEFTHVESFQVSKCDFDKNILTLSWKVKNVGLVSLQLPKSCTPLSSQIALPRQGSIDVKLSEICDRYSFTLVANESYSGKPVENTLDFIYPIIEEFTATYKNIYANQGEYSLANALDSFAPVLGGTRNSNDAMDEAFLDPDALDDTLCVDFEGGLYTPWGPRWPEEPRWPKIIRTEYYVDWKITSFARAEIQGIADNIAASGHLEVPRKETYTLIAYSNQEGISISRTAETQKG